MLYLSDRMTSASGSIGGTTFSHNRAGLYTRARRVPVNPQSAFQVAVRNALTSLQAQFPTLSTADQDGWSVYGQNVPVPGRLGNQIKLTGQQWFVRVNSYNVQAGLAVQTTPPTQYALPFLSPPTATIVAAGTTASIAYNNTDEWANETGGALLIYASRPQDPVVKFFKGPYRFAGTVLGDTTTPPTSPATISLPFVIGVVGSLMYFRAVCVTAFARASSPIPFVATA